MSKTDQKILKEFIKKEFVGNTGFSWKKSMFSNMSKIMLQNIFLKMKDAELNVPTFHESILDLTDEFPKGPEYKYIIKSIRDEIESHEKIGKKIEFQLGERNISIYCILPIKKHPTEKIHTETYRIWYSIFTKYAKQMYVWLYVATYYSQNTCSKNLNIFLYLTDHKKMLSHTCRMEESCNRMIDRDNVNSAFTFSCNRSHHNNEIYIFRKEEWFKVFIHESFHAFHLDFSSMSQSEANRNIFRIFPIKCDPRVYESYTEMWGEIINIMFLVYFELRTENMDKLLKKTEEYLIYEKWFSIFQCVKILNYYGMEYRELYEDTSRAEYAQTHKYKENTSVFSYYILKSIFMTHIDDFLDWCVEKNRGSLFFKKTQSNIVSLIQFIREHHQSSELLRMIDITEKWMDTHKSHNNWIMNTMRMTVFGIEDIL